MQLIPITYSNVGVSNSTINNILSDGDVTETDNCAHDLSNLQRWCRRELHRANRQNPAAIKVA